MAKKKSKRASNAHLKVAKIEQGAEGTNWVVENRICHGDSVAHEAPLAGGARLVCTYEVLENVLRFLPTKDLLLAQRVSKHFNKTINTSLILRRKLHFVFDTTQPGYTFVPFLPHAFQDATINYRHYSTMVVRPTRISTTYFNKSWRKLVVAWPAYEEANKLCVYLKWRYVYPQVDADSVKFEMTRHDGGILLGELMDAILAKVSAEGLIAHSTTTLTVTWCNLDKGPAFFN